MAKNRTSFSIFILTFLLAPFLYAKGVSQKEARQIVEKIPEVQEFADMLAQHRSRLVIYPEELGENKNLHQFYVGESLGDHTNRWNTFGVDKKSGEIFVFDMMRGKFLPYTQWQKSHWQKR